MKSLADTVKRNLGAGGIRPGDRVVAGVSGGADSMCLLAVLLDLGKDFPLRILVAHLEHGIRGTASEKDMEFVRGICRSWGIPFVDFRAWLGGGASENEAREARYAFFRLVYKGWRAKAVLLGHHSGDVAENMLFRMARGVPPEGLPGFGPRDEHRDMVIMRPLWDVEKKDMEAYLEVKGVPWRVDESNFLKKYSRNIIRWDVLPRLEEVVPGAGKALKELAKELRDDSAALAKEADRLKRKAVLVEMPGFWAVDLKTLRRAEAAVVRRVLRGLVPGGGRGGWREMLEMSDGEAISLGGGVTVRREGSRLLVCSPGVLPVLGRKRIKLPVPGEAVLGDGSRICAEVIHLEGGEVEAGAGDGLVEYFHPNILDAGELVVRNRRPGERFHPLGAPGKMKLQDFLVNEGVPREVRDTVPLVEAGGRVVWVCGVRIGEEFRLRGGEDTALRMDVRPRGRSFVRAIWLLSRGGKARKRGFRGNG